MTAWSLSICVFIVSADSATRRVPLAEGPSIVLLAGAEARSAIVEDQHDPFLRVLSPIDFELRLGQPLEGVPDEVKLRRLKRQFTDSVVDWQPSEIQALTAACRRVAEAASRSAPDFVPAAWKFVVTDGTDESGAAYTRHDAIILPRRRVAGPDGRSLTRLVAHETTHVFTRLNPRRRDRLFAVLGFRRVGPIRLGPALSRRRITNPDAPTLEHVIRAAAPGRGPCDMVLVTLSKSERYSPALGRHLFAYLETRLFPVEMVQGDEAAVVGDSAADGLSTEAVAGFYDQIGRNTRYIIHPEEILAENVAMLLTGEAGPGGAADRRVLQELARALREP